MRSLRARFTGSLLKPGQTYTAERIKNALAQMKRSLTQQHRLASSVEENPPQYRAQGNLVDVSFKVNLGPVVTVEPVVQSSRGCHGLRDAISKS